MANKKLKLLYLAQYLWEQTDEQHPGTMQEIIAYLASCGISACLLYTSPSPRD